MQWLVEPNLDEFTFRNDTMKSFGVIYGLLLEMVGV
jgi:hypothetical protein